MKTLFFTTFLFLTIIPSALKAQCPTVDAGPDIIQCSGSIYQLNGITSNATGYYWTSLGAGTFFPDMATANATYSLPTSGGSSNDYSALVFTAIKGGCPDVHDTMYVFYNPIIGVDAGSNQNVCSDISSINLNGSVNINDPYFGSGSGAVVVTSPNKGTWSNSGTGSFADANSVNTTYTFSPADILAGSVTLTLTSTNMGDCTNASDQVVVTINTCTGIASLRNESIMNVYTDPNGSVHIDFKGSYGQKDIWVINLLGEKVRSIVTSEENYEISGLHKGTYILKAAEGENYESRTIMIF